MNKQILQTLIPESSGTYYNTDPVNYNYNKSKRLLYCRVSGQFVTIRFSIVYTNFKINTIVIFFIFQKFKTL